MQLAAPAADPQARSWKGLIKVGYACNNHCTFCHTLDYRDLDGTGPLVSRRIERAKELGYGMVVVSGGEVTMRKELLAWAARTASLGLDFGLVTNGRMLAYRELVEKLLRLRLRYVYLSLHGGERKVHNSLVRAEAFDETVAAIRNLAGRVPDFTVNTVVTRQNLDHLGAVVDLVLPLPALTLKFSMVQPKGGGDHAFTALVPEVELAAARIGEAIRYGLAEVARRGGATRFAHDGVPLCLLPGLDELYDDLGTHGFAAMTEAFEPDFFPIDDGDKIQPAPCAGCALAGPCPGLYRTYFELRGAGALRPRHDRPRSNSFTYAPERRLAKLDGGGGEAGSLEAARARCPIYPSPLPYHRGRHLLLDGGDHLIVHHAASRDFAEAEIVRTKEGRGQVYLDRSRKSAPDDFAGDLAPLELAPWCEGCAQRERCTGTYRLVDEDRFTRDDRIVGAWIDRLAAGGLVVDVGCGDGRYGDRWAAAATAGRLRYLGIEPEKERAKALGERWPWAEVRAIPVEELALETVGGPIDGLLCLRSWNHLAAPRTALLTLAGALRPGGLFLIADNVAFGLVRTAAQRAQAERSAARWEHLRNDDGAAALAALAGLPLELVEHHEVGRGTSNQWLLVLRRRPD